jgi:hypothetical protein
MKYKRGYNVKGSSGCITTVMPGRKIRNLA